MRKLALYFSFVCVMCAEPLKLGVILPLTGDAAFIGEQIKAGMEMRLEEQREKGGGYGIVIEDDQCKPAQAVVAYKKLVSIDKCGVILAPCTSDTLAGFAARDKKLFWGMSWDKRAAADKLAFIHCTPVEPQAELLLKTLAKLGVKRVAVVGEVQQGSMAMQDALAELAPSYGLELKIAKTNADERDFRSIVLKFRDFKPQAYVSLIFMPGFEILNKAVKQMEPDALFTAVEGFSYLPSLEAYEGSFYVAGNEPTPEFSAKALKEAGKPAIGFFANGYDMMDMILNATEAQKAKLKRAPTNEEVAAELMNLKDYPGAVGALTMGADRRVISPAVLKKVVGGKAKVVSIEEL